MAILYRSYTVWSCATGRVPGGDHLPTGELYRGIIYFRHIDSVGDMHPLSCGRVALTVVSLSQQTLVRLASTIP